MYHDPGLGSQPDTNPGFLVRTITAKKILVLLNVFSFLPFLLVNYIHGRNLKYFPFFRADDRFADWLNSLFSSVLGNPYLDQGKAIPCYGPLTYLLFKPFIAVASLLHNSFSRTLGSFLHLYGSVLWFFVGIAAVAVTAFLCIHAFRVCSDSDSRALAQADNADLIITNLQLVLVAYPILLAFDRGNLELITLALVACYVCSFFALPGLNPRQSSWVGTVALSCAVAIKPYLFLYVLFNGKSCCDSFRLKQFLLESFLVASRVAVVTALITFTSFILLKDGSLSAIIDQFLDAQARFVEVYTLLGKGDLFYISPYTLLKQLFMAPSLASLDQLRSFYHIYVPISFLFSLLLLASSRIYALPPGWSRFLLLTSLAVFLLTFPSGANEYKAVYVILPLLLCPPVLQRLPGMSSSALLLLGSAFGLCLFICLNRYVYFLSGSIASPVSSLVVLGYVLLAACLVSKRMLRRLVSPSRSVALRSPRSVI